MRITWAPEARRQVREIWHYIGLDSPEAADPHGDSAHGSGGAKKPNFKGIQEGNQEESVDEGYERIPQAVKDRVAKMTVQEAEARFEELKRKLGPNPLGLGTPEPTLLEEHEEWVVLKKRLGYS